MAGGRHHISKVSGQFSEYCFLTSSHKNFSSGFFVIKQQGHRVNIRDEIEQIRRELNIPDYQMCNIFDMSLEEFRRYRSNMRQGPGTYGLIMFVIETRRPLKTIERRNCYGAAALARV